MNTILNKKLGAPGLSDYANASGAHAPEFRLDYYNGLTTADYTGNIDNGIKIMNDLLPELDFYVNEYQRQVDYHMGRGDSYNAQIASKWRDTAKAVRNEVNAKIDFLKTKVIGVKGKSKLTLEDIGSANLLPQNSSGQRVDDKGNVIDSDGNIVHKPGTEGSESFFKKADGSFKWLNISGSVAAAVAIGFGIKFLVKKFTK